MKDKEIENNGACVIGRVLSGFSYSHETYGERFYRTDIIVPRSSGITDAVPLMVSGKLMDGGRDWQGGMVEAIGQFRSYNRHEERRNRLVLSVFAREAGFVDGTGMEGGGRRTRSSWTATYARSRPTGRRPSGGR